jgi:hypothetical protein
LDWLTALDIDQAAAVCRTDIFGDWHSDPWDWPELEWLVQGDEGRRIVVSRLGSDRPFQSMQLDVAKENYSTRPAMVFDIVDRLSFEALVGRESIRLWGHAPSWVYSWRLRRSDPQRGHFNDLGYEWEIYRHHMVRLSEFYSCGLVTDVVSYFASIPIDDLIEAIHRRCGGTAITNRIALFLNSWDRMAGRGGLPQRSNASSVLANMYLTPVDELIAEYGVVTGSLMKRLVPNGTAATRWVDDVWIFNNDIGLLREAQLGIEGTLRSLGLQMNLAKTDVLCESDLVAKVRNLEHSAVEVALTEPDEPDFEPLQEMVDRLIEQPERANKTSIRFAAVRISNHGLREDAEKLLAVAHRMPHGAAALARLFTATSLGGQLADWYAWYVSSSWGRIAWSVAQFGRMFPSAVQPPPIVREVFEALLQRNVSVSMTALAAQRLAAWDPDTARLLFRGLLPSLSHPQERRILALAAHNAGEERRWIRQVLTEYEENAATLAMLVDRNFAPVPPGADFKGS